MRNIFDHIDIQNSQYDIKTIYSSFKLNLSYNWPIKVSILVYLDETPLQHSSNHQASWCIAGVTLSTFYARKSYWRLPEPDITFFEGSDCCWGGSPPLGINLEPADWIKSSRWSPSSRLKSLITNLHILSYLFFLI